MTELEPISEEKGPETIEELARMVKSGEGEITGDDIRKLAETEDVPEHLRTIIDLAAKLIDRREKWGKDTLTELMAYTRLHEELQGAFERSRENPDEVITVVLYDLDHLGEANNTGEGHKGGDRLIQAFARPLEETFNPKETEGEDFRTGIIGRYRLGDEFLATIRGTKETAEQLDQTFQEKLDQTKVEVGDQEMAVSAIGVIAQLDPERDLDEQLNQVSTQLIQLKAERARSEEDAAA